MQLKNKGQSQMIEQKKDLREKRSKEMKDELIAEFKKHQELELAVFKNYNIWEMVEHLERVRSEYEMPEYED